MKAKGFTLIELVVACTLLLILTQVATTTMYNFMQATTNLKNQFQNLRNNIAPLYALVSQAKNTYASNLVFQAFNPANQAVQGNAETQIQQWNSAANSNQNPALIAILIGNSYIPSFRTVQVWTNNNGTAALTSVTVQIVDMDSLLRAYLLTDDGTPTGNIVATLTVGTILDPNPQGPVSPTLPVIDWRSGTLQEIIFPTAVAL